MITVEMPEERIAKMVTGMGGMTADQIRGCIAELVRTGWITPVGQRDGVTTYALSIPKGVR